MATYPALKMMTEKLYNEMSAGRITGEWEESFIDDMYHRTKRGDRCTEKQIAMIEKLFERY